VQEVLHDVETSRLDARHKVLFKFIDRVNYDSPAITADDVASVRAAGWTDEELYFAITVCALFNFYNRWVDANGVGHHSAELYAMSGERLAQGGYAEPGSSTGGEQKP
jgi:hypothetical protein